MTIASLSRTSCPARSTETSTPGPDLDVQLATLLDDHRGAVLARGQEGRERRRRPTEVVDLALELDDPVPRGPQRLGEPLVLGGQRCGLTCGVAGLAGVLGALLRSRPGLVGALAGRITGGPVCGSWCLPLQVLPR